MNGGDNAKDSVQDPENEKEDKPDQDQAKDRSDGVVDEHGDLEVHRFLAMRVELGRIVPFQKPDQQGWQKVPGKMDEDAKQSAGVAEGAPSAHVRDIFDVIR